ncbi:MAG: hypothetical protein ACR2MN_04675 [Acidimicrobiales bacterium]
MVTARIVRLLAAAAVLIGGYCHYHLWDVAYRHSRVRELFVINAIASLVIGLALAIGPRRLAALGGIGLSVLTLVAFALSRGPGVPSFHGTFTETGLQPSSVYVLGVGVALMTLIAEGVALVLSLVILAWAPHRPGARGAGHP